MRTPTPSDTQGANDPRTADIFIGNRERIDTSNNEPEADFLTWMRVLTVSELYAGLMKVLSVN